MALELRRARVALGPEVRRVAPPLQLVRVLGLAVRVVRLRGERLPRLGALLPDRLHLVLARPHLVGRLARAVLQALRRLARLDHVERQARVRRRVDLARGLGRALEARRVEARAAVPVLFLLEERLGLLFFSEEAQHLSAQIACSGSPLTQVHLWKQPRPPVAVQVQCAGRCGRVLRRAMRTAVLLWPPFFAAAHSPSALLRTLHTVRSLLKGF